MVKNGLQDLFLPPQIFFHPFAAVDFFSQFFVSRLQGPGSLFNALLQLFIRSEHSLFGPLQELALQLRIERKMDEHAKDYRSEDSSRPGQNGRNVGPVLRQKRPQQSDSDC